MPVYDFNCPKCGRLPDIMASIDDDTIACPDCGGSAKRAAVYQSQGVIFKGAGFTKSVVPPKHEKEEVQKALNDEMTKRNYPSQRVYDDLQKAKVVDEQGNKSIDIEKMTKEV